MKMIPKVKYSIDKMYKGVHFKLSLEDNLIFISGDSGEGKSFLYSFLEDLQTESSDIEVFNYTSILKDISEVISKSQGKFFVIDNADLLLDLDLRQYIAYDTSNQYILIGRNPYGLMLTSGNIRGVVWNKGDKLFCLEM